MRAVIGVNDLVDRETKGLLISDRSIMDRSIAQVLDTIGKGDKKQKLGGMATARKFIDMIKKELKVSNPYLHSVNESKKYRNDACTNFVLFL